MWGPTPFLDLMDTLDDYGADPLDPVVRFMCLLAEIVLRIGVVLLGLGVCAAAAYEVLMPIPLP